MKEFDVLLTQVYGLDGGHPGYHVVTVLAGSEGEALVVGRRRLRASSRSLGLAVVSTRALAAGPCGSYDKFVGKYVGQFIDEASCR